MIWQGSYGNDIYNNTRYYGEGMFGYTNCFASTKNRYRAEELSFVNPVSGITTIYPQNTNTNMPRAILGDPNQNTRKSDRYVEDGSYFRLKTINLNYNFGPVIKGISDLSLFGTITNVFTITGYSWFDPDVNAFGSDASRRGVDIFSYPSSRTYSIGFKLTL